MVYGQKNTLLGACAGGGIETGLNNTIIGAYTCSATTTLNNNVILADGEGNQRFRADDLGHVGISSITAPTAWLHLPAGTAAANTGPLKFTGGSLLATPESGVIEYDGTSYYGTDSGAVRKAFATGEDLIESPVSASPTKAPSGGAVQDYVHAELAAYVPLADVESPISTSLTKPAASGAVKTYVDTSIAAITHPVVPLVHAGKTADYTVLTTDLGKQLMLTGSTTRTFTLPSAVTAGEGWYIYLACGTSSNDAYLQVNPVSSQTFNQGAAAVQLRRGQDTLLVSDGANWIMYGKNQLIASNQAGTTAASVTYPGQVAIGSGAACSGTGANLALGASSSATVLNAIALNRSLANINGKLTYSGGVVFSATGDCQTGKYVLLTTTTNATATALTTTGGAIETYNQVTLPANSQHTFVVTVTGRRTSTAIEYVQYRFTGTIYRGTNYADTVLDAYYLTEILGRLTTTSTVAIAANTSYGTLGVTVTGEAGKTFHWVAEVNTVEAQ